MIVSPTSQGTALGACRSPPRIASRSTNVATASASHCDAPVRPVIPIASGAMSNMRCATTVPATPAAASGNEATVRLAFADAFRMLANRIGIFVNLPLRSLDRLTLQAQLNGIGKFKDSAA